MDSTVGIKALTQGFAPWGCLFANKVLLEHSLNCVLRLLLQLLSGYDGRAESWQLSGPFQKTSPDRISPVVLLCEWMSESPQKMT